MAARFFKVNAHERIRFELITPLRFSQFPQSTPASVFCHTLWQPQGRESNQRIKIIKVWNIIAIIIGVSSQYTFGLCRSAMKSEQALRVLNTKEEPCSDQHRNFIQQRLRIAHLGHAGDSGIVGIKFHGEMLDHKASYPMHPIESGAMQQIFRRVFGF